MILGSGPLSLPTHDATRPDPDITHDTINETMSKACYIFTDEVPASPRSHNGFKLSCIVVVVVLLVVVLVVLGVAIFS